MKTWLIISFLLIITSCRQTVQETYFTPEKAAASFRVIEEACNRDGGNLWGRNLYGPLMFIDRASRKIIANQPDDEGLLKLKDGIYTGFYPRENIITTTTIVFGGKLFGMAPLPVEEDDFRIKSRGIHALFHSFQKMSGMDPENFNLITWRNGHDVPPHEY